MNSRADLQVTQSLEHNSQHLSPVETILTCSWQRKRSQHAQQLPDKSPRKCRSQRLPGKGPASADPSGCLTQAHECRFQGTRAQPG